MANKNRVDFRMVQDVVSDLIKNDTTVHERRVLLQGITEDLSPVRIRLEFKGSDIQVEAQLKSLGISRLNDIVSTSFKVVQKQTSLFQFTADEDQEEEDEFNEEEGEEE